MTEHNELQVIEHPVRALSVGEIKEVARAFYASGLFQDVRDEAQAITKIMAGQELGVGPFSAMRGINIIKGQLAPGAGIIGALIKKSGKYDYRVVERSTTKCHIEFYQNGQKIGDSQFTMEDAKRAGLTGKSNWSQYPASMLFARTLTDGARTHCPDVFMGPVYVPEELGQDVVEGEFAEETIVESEPVVTWSDLQVAAVMSGMQSEDRGKSIAFLNMSGLKHDADVEQIAMLCQEYNNGLADGLEKKDALADAQKKVLQTAHSGDNAG